MIRYYILQDDPTTAGNGSKVIGAFRNDTNEDRSLALEHDEVYCGACESAGKIVCVGPRLSDTFDGLEAALSDDICVCKCEPAPRLINTTQNMFQTVTTAEIVEKGGDFWLDIHPQNEQFTLRDQQTRRPLANVHYRIKTKSRTILQGVTDANGKTQRVATASLAALALEVIHQ